jgi:hypothetical protein
MADVRAITNKLHDAVAEGLLTWEMVGKAALLYMSEDDVADLAHCEEFFPSDDTDDEDEDDSEEEGDRIEEPPYLGENDPDTDLFEGDIYAVYHE